MATILLTLLVACMTEPTTESFLQDYGDTLCAWQEECGGSLVGDECAAHYASLSESLCAPIDPEAASACLDEIEAYTETCEPTTTNPSCALMFC